MASHADGFEDWVPAYYHDIKEATLPFLDTEMPAAPTADTEKDISSSSPSPTRIRVKRPIATSPTVKRKRRRVRGDTMRIAGCPFILEAWEAHSGKWFTKLSTVPRSVVRKMMKIICELPSLWHVQLSRNARQNYEFFNWRRWRRH